MIFDVNVQTLLKVVNAAFFTSKHSPKLWIWPCLLRNTPQSCEYGHVYFQTLLKVMNTALFTSKHSPKLWIRPCLLSNTPQSCEYGLYFQTLPKVAPRKDFSKVTVFGFSLDKIETRSYTRRRHISWATWESGGLNIMPQTATTPSRLKGKLIPLFSVRFLPSLELTLISSY